MVGHNAAFRTLPAISIDMEQITIAWLQFRTMVEMMEGMMVGTMVAMMVETMVEMTVGMEKSNVAT